MSKRMLWPTMTASPMNSRNVGRASAIRGASTTIACVIPVSTVMNGGIGAPGLTRVWKVPSRSPPRYRTAPISVISQSAAEPPVVSRSRMQKGTSMSGAPRSSKVRCRARVTFPEPRPNMRSIEESISPCGHRRKRL